MELNIKKIESEMKRLNLNHQQLANLSGLKSRQMVRYYLKTKNLRGAEPFAKAFGIEPKDLIR